MFSQPSAAPNPSNKTFSPTSMMIFVSPVCRIFEKDRFQGKCSDSYMNAIPPGTNELLKFTAGRGSDHVHELGVLTLRLGKSEDCEVDAFHGRGLRRMVFVMPNVRAKRAATACRAGQQAHNGPKAQRLMASVTCRWRSA